MGLLEAPGAAVSGFLDPLGKLLQNPFGKKKVKGNAPAPDFPRGFEITEIQDGKKLTKEKISLLGNMLPMIPFTFGGEQRIQKEYYPGHSEPNVQIFGPKESDITIKGRLKDKRYKDKALRGASTEMQEQLDAIRIRGNLCIFQLGEWHRYGFIEKTSFEMNTLREYDYSITLSIVGFNEPQGCKIVTNEQLSPVHINKKLLADAAAFQSTYSNIPKDMPQSLADFLNDQISDIAGILAGVTTFVDRALGAAEGVVGSANRAIGLIKYAKLSVFRYLRRVGSIVNSVEKLGPSFVNSLKITGTQNNIAFIFGSKKAAKDINLTLFRLEAQFAALSKTVPKARYKIKSGDTLQKIAFKFYNDSLQWKKIYDHNKLISTNLQVGKVLEIPRE